MVNKIAVDGKAILVLAEVYPIRFDLNGTVTLLEKENVRNHIRTGVGAERIVGQTNGTQQLRREPVLHADETTLQVLKEPGRSSTSKSYMWLYRTSGCAKQAIVLYEYQPTRKAEHAEAFLKGFSGWLHADGYQGYHKLPGNIRVVGCWAHARRKFDEALGTLPQEKRKDSPAAMGECYCSQLFKLEQEFAELTPEERYEKRLEQEKPVTCWSSGRI